jgi:hypothetical protein
MASGSSHFKCSLYAFLSLYVSEIKLEMILLLVELFACVKDGRLVNRSTIEKGDNISERVHAVDLQIIDDSRLTNILAGHNEALVFLGSCLDGNRQCATNGLKGAVESQFPYKHIV